MGKFEQVIERAQALGGDVARLVGPAVGLRDRGDRLNAALDAFRRAGESKHTAAVRALSEGRLEPQQLLSALDNEWVFDSPASKAMVAAAGAARSLAESTLRDAAEPLFAAVQKVAAGCVAESTKLVGQLPAGVVDDRSAVELEAAEAWKRLLGLHRTFYACSELHWTLMLGQYLDGPADPSQYGPAAYTQFEAPQRRKGGPAQLQLAASVRAGANPGLYDWASARHRWTRDQKQAGKLVDQPPMTVVRSYSGEAGAAQMALDIAVAANTLAPVPRFGPQSTVLK